MGDSGKGTDTCGRCGQDKEPTRHNSEVCRACDKDKRQARAAHPSTADLLARLNVQEVQEEALHTLLNERLDRHADTIRALLKRVKTLEGEVSGNRM